MQSSKGDPSYPRKTKPRLPLKPTNIDSKGTKRVNPKGQRRDQELPQVRDADNILADGKQEHNRN